MLIRGNNSSFPPISNTVLSGLRKLQKSAHSRTLWQKKYVQDQYNEGSSFIYVVFLLNYAVHVHDGREGGERLMTGCRE